MWVFDRSGDSALLFSATGRIFASTGVQVGWLNEAAVCTLEARQVGWFSGGLLRDLDGAVSGFTQTATDATRPALPEPTPAVGVFSLPVAATRPQFPPPNARSTDRGDWSTSKPAELFRAA